MFNLFKRKPSEPVVPTLDAKATPLRERLARTAQALSGPIYGLFRGNPKLDEQLLEDLETALLSADVGVAVTKRIIDDLRVRVVKREFADADGLLQKLRADLFDILLPVENALIIPAEIKPFVIMVIGVNGVGKTTTIGKLTQRYKQSGMKVMLAAGDTFRAAAVEQLQTWGARNDVEVLAQGHGADSASVAFDAYQAAKARDVDLLIVDTAGRLHTQGHLVAELAKVKRVLGKIDADAPHETLLVIDGGTGQNALNQARQFHKEIGLTGLAVTKLDGTARGGILFAIADELKIPLRYIGVGETLDDLRTFRAADFLDALMPREVGVK
jgi:fused signal recognition particle receptor